MVVQTSQSYYTSSIDDEKSPEEWIITKIKNAVLTGRSDDIAWYSILHVMATSNLLQVNIHNIFPADIEGEAWPIWEILRGDIKEKTKDICSEDLVIFWTRIIVRSTVCPNQVTLASQK